MARELLYNLKDKYYILSSDCYPLVKYLSLRTEEKGSCLAILHHLPLIWSTGQSRNSLDFNFPYFSSSFPVIIKGH